MARGPKGGLDYFPLDVDFFEDDKILQLEDEHGEQGVLVYLRLLCRIYRNNGYYEVWDSGKPALVAKRIGIGGNPRKVDLIVRSCVKWSLFDRKLFDAGGVLTSVGIQRRYLHAIRERAKKAAAKGRKICVDPAVWLLDEEETRDGLVCVRSLDILPGNNAQFSREESGEVPGRIRKEEERKEEKSKEEERRGAGPALAPLAAATAPHPPSAALSPAKAFGLVNLSGTDYEGLCARFGQGAVDAKIAHMDAWLRETGRSVRSCAATLNDWLTQDLPQSAPPAQVAPPAGKKTGAHAFTQRTYTDEELDALLYTDLDDLQP